MYNTTSAPVINVESKLDELFHLYVGMRPSERTRLYGFLEAMIKDAAATFAAHGHLNEVERMGRHLDSMHFYLTNPK